MRLRTFSPLLVGSLALLGACSSPPQESIGAASSDLYAAGSLHPWPNGIVPVCWETGLATDQYGGGNPLPAHSYPQFDYISRVMRDAVENGWGRAANLSFVGWGDCPSTKNTGNPGTVAIFFDPAARNSSTTIGYLPDQWTRMQFNPGPPGSPSDEATLRATVLHEMGHALGFSHELDRPDHTTTDPGCNYGTNSPGDYVTPYDHDSIMNYSYCSNPGVLSPYDIEGVRSVYGRKPSGSLVGDGGLCANIWGGALTNGQKIASFRCTGKSNDVWSMSTGYYGGLTFRAGNGCALGVYDDPNAFDFAYTDACNGQATSLSDSWSPKNLRILGYGNLCLDTSNGPFSPVVMKPCNGSASQTWSFSAGAIVNGDTSQGSQCLDVYNNADADGATVGVWTCNGQKNQQWTVLPGGSIRPGSSSRVLDVFDFQTTSGTKVQLFTAKAYNRANQQFILRMNLAQASGRVLDVNGGQPTTLGEGAQYDVYPSNGGPNQFFDFWP